MQYQYLAVDATGKDRRGVVDAENETEATRQLRAQGVFPTQMAARVAKRSAAPPAQSLLKRLNVSFAGAGRIAPKKLVTFTRQLAVMLGAGMPLVQALRTLADIENDPGAEKVVTGVIELVEGGSTFSDALAAYPASFSPLYVNMVRAGELSGALAEVLLRQAVLMEKQRRLRGRIKTALTYPIAVLIIALAITCGLMVFIVPKFATIFKSMLGNRPLPGLTEFVLNVSNFMMHRGYWILLMIAAVVLVWKILRRTRAGNLLIDSIAIKSPPFGELLTLSAAARFSQTLGNLMAAGVSVLQALQIVGRTAGNAIVSQAVGVVHDAVKEGEGISAPLASTGVFPKVMVSMIKVGEDTGSLPEMLERVAETYEEEVDNAVEAMTALIEPAMIIVLAVVIGTIVIALFLPIIVIISDLGG